MNNSEYGEREITLCELFKFVLGKWRIILIVTVLAMIISGGYQYYRMNKSEAPEEIGLTAEQKESVEKVAALETNLENMKKKMDASSLFNMDAMNASIFTMQYFVDHEKGKEIKELYQNALDTHFGENEALDSSFLIVTSGDESSLVVCVIGRKEDITEAAITEIKAYIDGFCKTVKHMVGDHSLLLVDETQTYGYSKELMQWQKSLLETSQRREQQLLQETQNLTEGQRQYLDLKNNEVLQENKTQTGGAKRELIKIMVFAGVLVFFSCCVLFVLIYFTSSRILTMEELSQIYHLNSLGYVYQIPKGLFSSWDRKILSIGKKKHESDEEKEVFILKNIELTCKERNVERICFVSLSSPSSWFENIETEIKKNKPIAIVEYIGQNAMALEKIVDIKNIILLVKLGKTRRGDMMSLLRLCDEYEVRIAGAVCCL